LHYIFDEGVKFLKSIYESNIKDWKKLIKSLDKHNDVDFETFKDLVIDCFADTDDMLVDDLCEFFSNDLGAYSDVELRDLSEEEIGLILEYLKG
jgi:hypothetical protein